MIVQPYSIVEVHANRWQINQGASCIGLRLTLYDAIQAAARYTVQELLAGNTIENPWPIQVERLTNNPDPVDFPFGLGL